MGGSEAATRDNAYGKCPKTENLICKIAIFVNKTKLTIDELAARDACVIFSENIHFDGAHAPRDGAARDAEGGHGLGGRKVMLEPRQRRDHLGQRACLLVVVHEQRQHRRNVRFERFDLETVLVVCVILGQRRHEAVEPRIVDTEARRVVRGVRRTDISLSRRDVKERRRLVAKVAVDAVFDVCLQRGLNTIVSRAVKNLAQHRAHPAAYDGSLGGPGDGAFPRLVAGPVDPAGPPRKHVDRRWVAVQHLRGRVDLDAAQAAVDAIPALDGAFFVGGTGARHCRPACTAECAGGAAAILRAARRLISACAFRNNKENSAIMPKMGRRAAA